jgi:hypothetical protein
LGKKKVRLFWRSVILKNCGEMKVIHALINTVEEVSIIEGGIFVN